MEGWLNQWRRSRFVWGQTDCVMATANYVRDLTGKDPAAAWRGTYDDEGGAVALYGAFGGVLGLVSHAAHLSELQSLDAPVAGSPVVCDLGGKEIAGVWLGDRVAFMSLRGCVEMRAKVLGAWKA